MAKPEEVLTEVVPPKAAPEEEAVLALNTEDNATALPLSAVSVLPNWSCTATAALKLVPVATLTGGCEVKVSLLAAPAT